jgi:3-oxosteroid 1-dehydrogenase
MATQEETYDFIIVGSGAGSGPAALLMKSAGKRPLIIEKEALIGGTSAYSGGMMWMPNHGVNGVKDSPEACRAYMDAVQGDVGPASTPARRDAYIEAAPEMIRFLEARGIEFVPVHWPDYYPDAPGHHFYRTLSTKVFDLNRLGPEWRDKMAGHWLMTTFPITAQDAMAVGLVKRTWKGKWVMAKILVRQFFRRGLLRQKLMGGGNALQGRIYEVVLREKIPIWTETKVVDFIVENDRVVGVVAERKGETIRVRANDGVLLNAGGFARNQTMRDKYQTSRSRRPRAGAG